MSNSTPRSRTAKAKPSKPRPDFPLSVHRTGRWFKKVKGRFCYFGKIADDPKGVKALKLWLEQRDDLLAGRKPRDKSDDAPTVADVANSFLNAKRRQLESGELSQRTLDDYKRVSDRFVEVLGKNTRVVDLTPADFARLRARIAKTCGPVAICNEVTRTKMAFKHAYDSELIDKPVRFGPDFKKPSAKMLRVERIERGAKLFEAAEIWAMLNASNATMSAFILLGINCGLGNADVGRLEFKHIDLESGWLDYPRPKTGMPRRCPLWPETIKAIRETVKRRPEPKSDEHAERVFVTKQRGSFEKPTMDCPVSKEFAKTGKELGIHRKGRSFYALRHSFRTIADETRDFPAVDMIMGHTPATNDMAARYRERINDDRLVAVSEYVRAWFLAAKPSEGGES